MFTPEPKKPAFQPILYPESYLFNRIEERYKYHKLHIGNVCLLKYFPKYYKNLKINQQKNPTFLSSKVKQVKIIRNFLCEQNPRKKAEKIDKILKNLLRTTRKTLKRLPKCTDDNYSGPALIYIRHLSQYFQRITHLNLNGYSDQRMCLSKSKEKEFERYYSYFWDANRFIKDFAISGYGLDPWMIIRKLNNCKRFLSSLKTLRLTIRKTISENREMFCELLRNKEFLEHVTSLNFYEFRELIRYRDLFEAVLKCCINLKSLSFPIENQGYYLYPDQDFSRSSPLNLNNCLPNLQVLELRTNNLASFAGDVELSFPLGIQKIIFNITDPPLDNYFIYFTYFKPRTPVQENFYQAISENSTKYLPRFFEKWKKLQNLKTLDLKLSVSMKMVVENFILPFLKAIPQLETFNCQFRRDEGGPSREFRDLDLNGFFKAIECLTSLKNVRFTREKADFRIFSVAYNPGKIAFFPNLSIIEIDTNCSPSFNLNKFLILFLHGLKSKPEEMEKEKSIKFSQIRLANVPDLVKLFRVLNTASQFKRLKICLQVDLFVETMGDLTSNFQSAVSVASNVAVKLNIYFVSEVLREEDEEYFKSIFRQMKWNIFKAKKDSLKTDYTKREYRTLLLGNQRGKKGVY